MGSLVSLLVLGAIYSIVYVVKNLSSSRSEGKRVFGESFPEVEVLEPAPEFVAPAPEKTSKKRASRAKQKRAWSGGTSESIPQPQPDTRPVRPVAADKRVPEKNEEEVVVEEHLVRLGSKSEAKRAFLYSEIFNRKY